MEEHKDKVEKKEHNSLKKLKEAYESLKNNYSLPEFSFLNEVFEIEDISSEDTELLLKKVRKQILEKIYYNSRTLETFMNPQNAPLFVFSIVKGFSVEENALIKDLYKKLVEFELEAFVLEAKYDEKKEADFIKIVGEAWKDISEDLNKIGIAMKTNYNLESKKERRGYLG